VLQKLRKMQTRGLLAILIEQTVVSNSSGTDPEGEFINALSALNAQITSENRTTRPDVTSHTFRYEQEPFMTFYGGNEGELESLLHDAEMTPRLVPISDDRFRLIEQAVITRKPAIVFLLGPDGKEQPTLVMPEEAMQATGFDLGYNVQQEPREGIPLIQRFPIGSTNSQRGSRLLINAFETMYSRSERVNTIVSRLKPASLYELLPM